MQAASRRWAILFTLLFIAISQATVQAQTAPEKEALSPKAHHKFGVIFKIDSYEFLKIPPDPRAKNPQSVSLIAIKSMDGVELKEPILMEYSFSPAIVEHEDQLKKLLTETPTIFGYETLKQNGRPGSTNKIHAEMENWSRLAAPGFRLFNSLEIVDAKGLDLNSHRKKLKRLSEKIQRDFEASQKSKQVD